MNNIQTKDADLNEIKNGDFKTILEGELKNYTGNEKDFISRIIRQGREILFNQTDNIPVPLLKQIDKINYKIQTYKVGEVYEILNRDDYSLIRNGFITIGGEASAGKTSFVTALSIDILRNNPETCFLFYSLDDPLSMSGKRMFSQLNQCNLFKQDIQDKHSQGKENILDRIFILDKFNINHIDGQAKAVKKITNCNKIIIGIDYLQIVDELDTPYNDRRDYLNNVLKQLKEYQKILEQDAGCIMFVLSQLSRNTQGNKYRYRETSEVENQSDICIDLEDYIEDSSDEKEYQSIEIKIRKNKLGKRGFSFKTNLTPHFTFSRLDYKTGTIDNNNTMGSEVMETAKDFEGWK